MQGDFLLIHRLTPDKAPEGPKHSLFADLIVGIPRPIGHTAPGGRGPATRPREAAVGPTTSNLVSDLLLPVHQQLARKEPSDRRALSGSAERIALVTAPASAFARLLTRSKANIFLTFDRPRDVISSLLEAKGISVPAAVREYLKSVATLNLFASASSTVHFLAAVYGVPGDGASAAPTVTTISTSAIQRAE